MPTLFYKSIPAGLLAEAGRITLPQLTGLLLLAAVGIRGWVTVDFLGGERSLDSGSSVSADPDATSITGPDLAALQALGLFSGNAEGRALTVQQTLPAASSLNLLLQGVMLGGEPEASIAVIVSNARQASYRLGESLPGAGRIVLEQVAADHVIVNNNGRQETLWLYDTRQGGSSGGANNAGGATSTSISGAIPLEVTGRLGGRTADDLPIVAASLAEIIQVSPAQENGQLIGYRLSPGVKLKEFVQLGLMTNDVVTEVNGMALNDMANLPRLYALMNDATEVSFSLLREGQPMTLRFSLTSQP